MNEVLVKKIGKKLRKYFDNNLLLNYFEKLVKNKYEKSNNKFEILFPSIFIIGPPRSGTTIFYQILLKEFNFFYFSNLSNFFNGSPLLTSLLLKQRIKNRNYELKSNHGYINGLFSPSEIGILNKKWFENGSSQNVRQLFAVINKIYPSPILIKNTFNTLRVENILNIFSSALFLYIKRDQFFNAQSIILSNEYSNAIDRLNNKISANNVTDDLYKKAIEIIQSFEQTKEKLRINKQDNFIEIEYEHFCQDPNYYLELIDKWLLNRKISLKRNQTVSGIDLRVNNIVKLNSEQAEYLSSLLE